MSDQIDIRAFWNVSYGLYIVTSAFEGKLNGQISNCVIQVTDQPAQLLISINKKELTNELISKSKKFAVTVLDQDAPMQLIGLFGFKSGRDVDKLSQTEYKMGLNGCPLVLQNAIAHFEAKVVNTLDVGTHTIFIGEVVSSDLLKNAVPMTYAYYHQVKKGKDAENSPISKAKPNTKTESEDIQPPQNNTGKYVCNICGYVYDPEKGDPDHGIAPATKFEDIPDEWVCPICGVGKKEFSLM